MNTLLFNILFLDIETASQQNSYDGISDRLKAQWDRKAMFIRNAEEHSTSELYSEKAGIYAEYGKVICIGIGGFFTNDLNELCFKVKTLSANSEKELLENFSEILSKHKAKNWLQLCAHNGKEFDFPYLSRRMLINNIKLPETLDLAGKKPWEVNHIDTMELWKFGDYKNYSSLDLLATIFNIPSSKSEMKGSDVNRVYHEENNIDKIKKYCGKDVAVLAQLFLKMKGLDLPKAKNIFIKN